jgi:uncharacterized membrane protein YfcA
MADAIPYLALGVGVFLGAIVQGVAGFAFSAVAGAILLHVRPPTEAVPLMMACSITVQAATLISLRRTMQWGGSVFLIGGGALGLPPALYLLHHVNTWAFRIGFGLFIAGYAAYMFWKCSRLTIAALAAMPTLGAGVASPTTGRMPASKFAKQLQQLRKWPDAALGFASGLVGGLTAMPGALPTIWCDLQGMPKDRQRGMVQPFIASMQLIALLLLWSRRDIPPRVISDMLITLPALAAGSALGIVLFTRVDDATFKRIVLATLFVAGLGLVV